MKIPLIKPYLPESVKAKVLEVIDSGYLTEGPVTKEFENLIADYVGCERCLAVSNCTVGLEMALKALEIGSGDEVIVPDFTYPATADAVAIVGATPVIVDVDPDTMLIDYADAEKAITDNTKAIMPVSEFGNPLDHDRLSQIKAKHGLYIIEDAACALGSEYKGAKTGAWSDVTVFSCHPRKFITTGEGGFICVNDSGLADWLESYKHFGMKCENGILSNEFVRIGTNYKMSNILAAIGVEQMKMVDELLERRRELAENYKHLISSQSGIRLPSVTPYGTHSYQTFSVFVENRDAVMNAMRTKGIEAQIGTYALHRHSAFDENSDCRLSSSFKGSDYACDHCLALPLFHEMTSAEQNAVVEELKKSTDYTD